jgi:hypothetical protein
MAETDRRELPDGQELAASSGADLPVVEVHTTKPDRAVFTEKGNTDGWIATDLVVERFR